MQESELKSSNLEKKYEKEFLKEIYGMTFLSIAGDRASQGYLSGQLDLATKESVNDNSFSEVVGTKTMAVDWKVKASGDLPEKKGLSRSLREKRKRGQQLEAMVPHSSTLAWKIP